ncbi:response regulator transcription factor [Streptococcus didelphis]|uniref:response regulator transcription factor n=1 Tax=Streptococcus didelphis TaxID=102886 RepID=UPI00036C59E5|nr:response regulator transcription factor [Streptococcus didelphis]WMB29706.1 response regulator transcription factor [Streptococcus didelphis]
MKILVIDDDIDLLKMIETILYKSYLVDTLLIPSNIDPNKLKEYDLIILDIMMPEISGFDFLKKYRNYVDAPILLLTAKDFEKDKVEGFALGADDYITKPFSINELRARVDAHIRREHREKHVRIIDSMVSCDILSRQLFCFDSEVKLTSSEYDICELLLKNKGQVFSKEKIYMKLYGYDGNGNSNTSITERIKLIRKKFISLGINPIKTIWGVGYKWEIEKV